MWSTEALKLLRRTSSYVNIGGPCGRKGGTSGIVYRGSNRILISTDSRTPLYMQAIGSSLGKKRSAKVYTAESPYLTNRLTQDCRICIPIAVLNLVRHSRPLVRITNWLTVRASNVDVDASTVLSRSSTTYVRVEFAQRFL